MDTVSQNSAARVCQAEAVLNGQIERFKLRIDNCQSGPQLQTYSRRVRRLLDKYRFWHEKKRQKLKFWEALLPANESISYLHRWMAHRPPTIRLFRTNATRSMTKVHEMTPTDAAEAAANAAELERVNQESEAVRRSAHNSSMVGMDRLWQKQQYQFQQAQYQQRQREKREQREQQREQRSEQRQNANSSTESSWRR